MVAVETEYDPNVFSLSKETEFARLSRINPAQRGRIVHDPRMILPHLPRINHET